MRLLIITGNELRHRYFAHTLAQQLPVVGVIYERKANKHKTYDYVSEDRRKIDAHFDSRGDSESTFFGTTAQYDLPHIPTLELETGASNTAETYEWIKAQQPDMLQLFGSSIIKDHLLEHFDQRVVNVHLGLSPYYRGSGTNYWPLVEGKPECVGATIHLAVLEVDAGGILHQVRPDLAPGDTPHDVGNKIIIKATEELPAVLKAYDNGELLPRQQQLSDGKVCYRKDLTGASVDTLYRNFSQGLIAQYIDSKSTRDAEYPLVTFA